MNKNLALRIVAVILALGMMVTVYGCKGKETKDNETKGEMTQVAIENGTAVVPYTSVNEKGEEIDATKIMTSIPAGSVNYSTTGSKVSATVKDEETKKDFIDKIENSGVVADKAEEIANDAENWAEFTYYTYIANTNSKKVAFRYIEGTGDDAVVITPSLDCEYGLPAGSATIIAISGYVNLAKYPDEEGLQAALSAMKINIIYTFLIDGMEDIDDWAAVTTMTMPISVDEA